MKRVKIINKLPVKLSTLRATVTAGYVAEVISTTARIGECI